ncbi:ELWxxDGT repeat protein [Vitiosangium sp. GDMCC 1.1324]|uniref:ELWxxDGT repeat protein n=1 Tax=Vitiosangium sp. (strain GDMCC 1.1324) TaxID=2138576 RepID=UPI00130DBC2B|nr:ELWxxDGT repeat protein [Vitiosangium sp. GDMCC 1.1324]
MRPSCFHASRLSACLALAVPLLAGLPLPSHAAESALLRDIRPGHDDTPKACGPLFAVGNTVYFSNQSASAGSELWRSDGSAEGTLLVKDVQPGPESSNPSLFGELHGSSFFIARGSTLNTELWKTDGTPTGTVRLLSVPSNGEIPTGVAISDWERVGSTLFFAAQFIGNQELWKTDGTPAGTTRVKDIAPGDLGSFPTSLTALGSTLYFGANATGNAPSALWKSDGTEAGTVQVWSPPSSGSVHGMDEVGGSLLVQVATRSSPTASLWKSDGTEAGTVKVADLPYQVWKRATLGDRLVMWMDNEVWVTDGTADGTRRLQTVSIYPWQPPVVVGGQVFFLGSDPSHGLELWTTDGTESGTRLVKDVRPGGNGALGAMAALEGSLYFLGADTQRALQLWKTDGTDAGTVKVAELNAEGAPSSYSMVNAGGRLFFTHARRLWVSDGTAAGTVRLVSSRSEPRDSFPGQMTRLGGLALFIAYDDEYTQVLWRTDGTDAGTVRVKNLREGSTLLPYVDPSKPWVVRGGEAFFISSDVLSAGGWQLSLWRTDGTEAGTSRLKVFKNPGIASGPLVLVGDTLFLAGTDAEHGLELWKSDGTAAGTVLVKDLAPGPRSSQFMQWEALGNRLFFWADDGTHGMELWTSDGTEAGTVLFKEFAPGSATGFGVPEVRRPLMAVLDGTLYFGARDTEHGLELWKTDGTPAGTVLLKDVNPGPEDSLSRMMVAGGRLYLSLDDGTHGLEPWVSDGTEAGTVLLKDVQPGEDNGFPLGFTRVGDTVLFLARDAEHGAELWKTDGTPAGTALLSDVWPGPDSALRFDPQTGVVALWGMEELGLAFFQGADAASGQELWVTDGTAAGTRRMEDLVPGEGSSTPTNLVRLGEKLVFAATDLLSGNEPRAFPLAEFLPDTTAPVLTCPASLSATAPDASGAAVSYPPATATDDRDPPVIEYGQASGSTFPVGTTVVTVTATDTAGNRSQCTFEVTVTRNAVPEEPGPQQPEPKAEGYACSSGGPGAGAFWSLLVLLAVACVRRRASPL